MDILTKQVIVCLRNRRYTFEAIGHILGISRQHAQQVYAHYAETIGDTLEVTRKYHDFRDTLKHVRPILYARPGFDPATIGGRTPIERIRNMVRRRDDYRCQMCFRKWVSGDTHFDVHHIDERLEGDVGTVLPANLETDDMITLCRKCHRAVAGARIKKRRDAERVNKR